MVTRLNIPATITKPVELEKYWLAPPGNQVQPYECINS